jgi:hypothetical protein
MNDLFLLHITEVACHHVIVYYNSASCKTRQVHEYTYRNVYYRGCGAGGGPVVVLGTFLPPANFLYTGPAFMLSSLYFIFQFFFSRFFRPSTMPLSTNSMCVLGLSCQKNHVNRNNGKARLMYSLL